MYDCFINPQRASAARVTVVVLCVCVHSNLPPHTLESQNRDTNGFSTIQRSFKTLPIFLKMLHSKVMALYAYLEQFQCLTTFRPRNKLLCYFEAYSYVFTAQTTGLWKRACDSLAQTHEMEQIYGSRILIVPRTSTYMQ